jgi:hypothetical protein
MPLIRLIYRSQNAIAVAGNRILIHYHDIVSRARERNARQDISGFLMFDRHRYYQILEGETALVDALYDRIKTDPRHTNIETLHRQEITKRGFPDWSMGSFLSEGQSHPLQNKHGILPNAPIDGERFLAFALEFVSNEPDAV